MEYTVEKANQMAAALRALPTVDDSKRKLDKQGVVRRLADEILALQKRGYTIEQVAESLTTVGLDITTPTLKSYLQRIKTKTGKTPKHRQQPAAVAAPSAPGTVQNGPRRSQNATGPKDGQSGPAVVAGSTTSEFSANDRERLGGESWPMAF